MGEYFIIAAGGTGAMCARSFIYMAAAGCAENKSTYHIMLMDKDKESDAMTACEDLLADYDAMRIQLGTNPSMHGNVYTFPKIVLHKWNFTDEIVDEYQIQTGRPAADLSNLTLRKLLDPRTDPATTKLLSTMYSADELDTDLNKGFYGHPNIGAPVFDYIRERFLSQRVTMADGTVKANTFMQALHSALQNGFAHVYLFGSLFGGTGATVIPNVVLALRTLRNPNNLTDCYGQTRLILGGSVIMPYFKLPVCPPDSVEALEKVVPADSKFEGQTKEALSYYHESGLLDNMMNLLLLGSSQLDVTSEAYARGGSQTQHFHTVLMLAGVAATRFFANRLGNMAAAIPTNMTQNAIPTAELLLWKTTTQDGNAGNHYTLIPDELDLTLEYQKMVTFLRFSVVVGVYMRLKFSQAANIVKDFLEVQGTLKQMKRSDGTILTPKTITQVDINMLYKDPVATAGAICRGFIQFMYDVALSGFDWSKYRVNERNLDIEPVKVNDKDYYQYRLGHVDPNATALFGERWMDFSNLAHLKQLLEFQNLNAIMSSMTLNDIVSYPTMDEGRADYLENRFPNSIAQIYEDDVLPALGLKKNWLGHMVKDNVWFSEIYDQLYRKCM